MLMGVVNLVPISSGTVSLVLGVFERFINSIKALSLRNIKLLFKGDFEEFARRTDFNFLVTLLAGLFVGMIITAIFLKQILRDYEVYTWSFFIGLILASVAYVMKMIEKVDAKNIALLLIGLAISFLLSIKSNPYSNSNFFYLFLCGIVGATGMVVPGISGSHLMLLMGNYELIVTEALPALTHTSTFMHGLRILLPFALGAIVSIVSFSYLLSWLMRDHRDATLSALAGFMLGSLPVVYPWRTPSSDMIGYVFCLPNWDMELLLAVIMAGLGAAMVHILEIIAKRNALKDK